MNTTKFPHYCLGIYLVIWAGLAINPVDRFTWLLENILPVIFVPVIIYSYLRFRLSNISYALLTVFMILHAIGSHYTYSEVPFIDSLLTIQFDRDHYDRFVHFSFGLLLSYPLHEFLRRIRVKHPVSIYLTFLLVISCSALYELMEYSTALVFGSDDVAYFVGAQGDRYDAVKDMLMAISGALITLLIVHKTKSGREAEHEDNRRKQKSK